MIEDTFVETIREYIDFINIQVGVYTDACSGFAGNERVIERQVFRISRAKGLKINEKGQPVIMRASYEDPSQPDVIHQRIIRTDDYIKQNAEGGLNEQQHSRAIIIFLFTYWEDEIRPRLAQAKNVKLNDIRSDIMGDLRILRHVILHEKGILKSDKKIKLKKISDLFALDVPLIFSYGHMHKIFVMAKQDASKLLLDHLGMSNSEELSQTLRDIAIKLK